MPENDFYTAELIPKTGKNWRGTVYALDWEEILKRVLKLERLTSLSEFFGTARPGGGEATGCG